MHSVRANQGRRQKLPVLKFAADHQRAEAAALAYGLGQRKTTQPIAVLLTLAAVIRRDQSLEIDDGLFEVKSTTATRSSAVKI